MRVILHPGLHKSATTLTQSFWGQVWGQPGDTAGDATGDPTGPRYAVRYPVREGQRPTGHAYLVRPLLRAFTAQDDPDLVLASLTATAEPGSLAEVVAAAERDGVGTLVLSAEDLDRVQAADVPALVDALGGHDLTVLLTATRPVHRWCANWQTLVRRGLAETPRAAAPIIERVAALTPGRLEELARTWPASRVVVRLVRTDPPEDDLPRDLARLLGLPEVTGAPERLARNVSLGTDTEVVRRINRADQGIGSFDGGAARLEELRGDGFTYRDVAEGADELALSDTCWEAARAEAHFLRHLPADVPAELHDPHDLLADWLDPQLPEWYATIARREAVVPELDVAVDAGEQLWRVRQERSAYRALLARSDQQVQRLRRRVAKREARIAELEAQLAATTSSRGWFRGSRRP